MRNEFLYSKAVMRKIKRRRWIEKKINKERALRKYRNSKLRLKKTYDNKNNAQHITITLPVDFRLLENMENVLAVIKRLYTYCSNTTIRYRIFVDMTNVIKIDIGAISIMLAVVNTCKKRNFVYGNYPNDNLCATFFENSGFLDHMKVLQGRHIDKTSKNLMIQRGFDKTSNKRIGEEVRKVVKHLTGTENTYRPVFSIIQEMCANSVEHANLNKEDKNWLVTLCYMDNKVAFTMIDLGMGIISTLRKKIPQLFKDTLMFKGNVGTLFGVFDKKYQSSTFDENRNKGLPRIKEINNFEYIDNLRIITNNVYLDFVEKNNCKELKCKFNGTFYYWELTKRNIEKWIQRKFC